MAGTPSLTSMLVFATLALLVLYHGFDRVTDLVGHGKSIEAAAEACPAPPGAIQRDTQQWQKIHAALVEELQAAQDAQGLDLVFYGDSITESWRGTDMNKSCSRDCPGIQRVYQAHFSKYRSIVLAIAGDQTGHLLWRLQNGETPDEAHQPAAAVVLIGTNDLGFATRPVRRGGLGLLDPTPCAVGTAVRLTSIVRHLRAALPKTRLVLLAVFPRGARARRGDAPVPWPNNYTAGIDMMNAAARRLARRHRHVEYLDCNGPFLRASNASGGGSELVVDTMPDLLHPNAAGMKAVAQCLDPVLTRLIPRPSGQGGDR